MRLAERADTAADPRLVLRPAPPQRQGLGARPELSLHVQLMWRPLHCKRSLQGVGGGWTSRSFRAGSQGQDVTTQIRFDELQALADPPVGPSQSACQERVAQPSLLVRRQVGQLV